MESADIISRATTSHLEHQRDTYWEMVCEQLDTKHQQFLVTLTMIDREILAREIKSVEEAKKQI